MKMRAVIIVSLVLFVALADARPELVKRETGRTPTDNNVQKLARQSPIEQEAVQNTGSQASDARGQIIPPQGSQGMLDPRAQMAMMMQAAQLEQMRRQAAQSQTAQQPTNRQPTSGTGQQGDNNRFPMTEMQQPFGNGQQTGNMQSMVSPMMRPETGMPPVTRPGMGMPPMMRPGMGMPPMMRPGMGMPPMMPQLMPPVSGKNITDGHIPVGPTPNEIMRMQQQQMMMMNEFARRQQQGSSGNFQQQGPSREEAERLMSQSSSREQFQRMVMLQQQQAMMAQHAALEDISSQNQNGDNTGRRTTVNPTNFPSATGMNSVEMSPQGYDPRIQMQMEMASQNNDPRLAMQIMSAQRMQSMSPDTASTSAPPSTDSSENTTPERESISAFVKRIRDRGMMQDPSAESQMMPGPRMQQMPMMLGPRMQQMPMMPDPRMQQPPTMQDPRMQQMYGNEDPRMQQIPTMQDPRIQQLSMMQGPANGGPWGQRQMMQNPRMQGPPMPGQMMQDPRMHGHTMPGQMMQDPRMQGPPVSGQMMQRQMMSDTTMQQPSLIPDQTSSSTLPTSASSQEDEHPTMPPVSGHDITNMRSSLTSPNGPTPIPLPSIQRIMDLESRLHDAREAILRSFYTDLLKYRDLSQQVQAQLHAKLAILYQIETQLATPLRYLLATKSTTPSLNLPVHGPDSHSSTIINRLRGINIHADPTNATKE